MCNDNVITDISEENTVVSAETEESAPENTKSDKMKGLLLLIPCFISAGVYAVVTICVIFMRIGIFNNFDVSNITRNIIIILTGALPYVITPVMYAVWCLITARFVRFDGGRKIFIISGLSGYVAGCLTIGLVAEVIDFLLLQIIGKYVYNTSYISMALSAVRGTVVFVAVFAIAITIYLILYSKAQKKKAAAAVNASGE